MIEYRWIEGDELAILDPVILSRGWTPLNHLTSRAICAFHGGLLIGFQVLQLFPHVEPLYVERDYRALGITEALVDRMSAFLQESKARGFMVVADSPHVIRLCESYGMKRIMEPVYLGSGSVLSDQQAREGGNNGTGKSSEGISNKE